jgi:pyruvate-formate lyase
MFTAASQPPACPTSVRLISIVSKVRSDDVRWHLHRSVRSTVNLGDEREAIIATLRSQAVARAQPGQQFQQLSSVSFPCSPRRSFENGQATAGIRPLSTSVVLGYQVSAASNGRQAAANNSLKWT